MTAREKAAGVLGPGKLRQLEEAGLVVVEGSPRLWEVEAVGPNGDSHWANRANPRRYAESATLLSGATGRIRPLYAGDPEDVRAPDGEGAGR